MSPKKSTPRKKLQKKTTTHINQLDRVYSLLISSLVAISLLCFTIHFLKINKIFHEEPIAKITIKKLSWAQRFFGIEPEKIVTTTYVAKEVKDAVLWPALYSYVFGLLEIVIQFFNRLQKQTMTSFLYIFMNGTIHEIARYPNSYINQTLKKLPSNTYVGTFFRHKIKQANTWYNEGVFCLYMCIAISTLYILFNAFNWIKKKYHEK